MYPWLWLTGEAEEVVMVGKLLLVVVNEGLLLLNDDVVPEEATGMFG